MVRASWIRVVLTVAGLSLISFFLVGPMAAGGPLAYLLIKVPRMRDEHLVGGWSGTVFFEDEKRTQTTVFRPDGTGYFLRRTAKMPFDWGTENGVLYTRRMATDAWSGSEHPYRFLQDQTRVHFAGVRVFDLVAGDMWETPVATGVKASVGTLDPNG